MISFLPHKQSFFFVSLDNALSETRTINCGVSQGSKLGHLFVLLYINDIPQALSDSHVHLYAMSYQHKEVTEIMSV